MFRLIPVMIFAMCLPKASMAQEVKFANTENLQSLLKELDGRTEALNAANSKKVSELQRQHKERLEKIQAAAIRELTLMQKRVAPVDLDEAVRIREAAKNIGISTEMPAPTPAPNPEPNPEPPPQKNIGSKGNSDPLVGTCWDAIGKSSKKVKGTFNFKANGSCAGVNSASAVWKRISSHAILIILEPQDPESQGILFHSKDGKTMEGIMSKWGYKKIIRLR